MIKKNNYRLFSFLDAVEEDELYRLKRYIHADFFNKNERFRQLFDAIWEAKTGKTSFQEIDPVILHQEVFSKKEASAISDDYSGILKLVRRFIAQEEYENDKQAQKRYLLRGLESRKAHHKFKLLVNREAKNYENGGSPNRNEYQENYFHDLLVAEQKYNYFNIHENRRPANSHLLQEFIDTLDRFHALTKIIYLGVMKRRSKVTGDQFRYGNIIGVNKVVENTPLASFPLLHIHHHINKLWENESLEQFDICKNMLLKYGQRFSLYEQKQLFQILINFCRLKVNEQQPRMWNLRQLDLYHEFFARAFCYTGKQQRKKQISLHHFKNYMQLLIELELFDQFEALQKQYAAQVYFKNQARKRFVHQYNTTALYFSQYLYYTKNKRTIGQEFAYSTALELIQSMEQELIIGKQDYPDVFYRILYEVLRLKIYYTSIKEFPKQRSAFYKYVNSQKQISPFFLEPYLNFAKVTLRLYQFRKTPKGDAENLQRLKNKLASMKIIEREWLLAQVGELRGEV